MTVPTAKHKNREYIYGPVPSRRLGRSLGIDLVPFKTCTYDCIYCQLGRTTNKTLERKQYVRPDTLIDELKRRLQCQPDFIAISGSGEPTLCSNTGEVISAVKEITDIPVAVLTNGSLLWSPEVRDSLRTADLVLPSLDAGTEQLYKYVNRPHRDILFAKMLHGLVKFREEYAGKYWLEVFLLSGVTTVEAQINTLAHCIKLICPDKVQVNTVHRPPTEDFAMAVAPERLSEAVSQLSEKAEIIVANHSVYEQSETSACLQDVLTLLRRRPCSVEDIALGLGLHRNSVVKSLEQLRSQRRAGIEYTAQGRFYKALT